MQGSGIEHAEGGGTPAGQNITGFQIWVNVPSSHKMDTPRYGTEPPENIPVVHFPDRSFARLLAGTMASEDGEQVTGPFRTVQAVQMVDYNVFAADTVTHTVPPHLDNVLVYVYGGGGVINGQTVSPHDCVHLNASEAHKRSITMTGASAGLAAIIFGGKMLRQPIAWHGPFVMTTQEEIRDTLREYRTGTFLKQRVEWDYKRIATKPVV